MNAILPVEAANTNVAPIESLSLLNCLARAIYDPSIDAAKLQTLREIVADEARLEFNIAMNAAQAEMLPVTRDAKNDQTNSKYARLETIDAAIRPIYTKHGFHLSFNSEPIDGPNDRIVCEVTRGRHTKKFQLEAAPDTAGPQGKPNKTPLHGLASTVSYLRRYLTCMIFNIVLANEDNDGNRRSVSREGTISEAEMEELHDLMMRGRIREGTVIEKMAPGLRSIGQLPAKDYPRIKNALLSRLTVLAERAAFAARTQNGDARP